MLQLLHKHLDKAQTGSVLHRHEWGKIARRCLLLGIVLLVIAAGGYVMQDHIPGIEAWLHEQGPWAPVILIAAFVIGSIFLIPADIFVFAAGALFGIWWGYLYVVIAECISMMIQFFLGRHVFKSRVEGFLKKHPKFAAIDKAVSKRGLKIAFLLRLGPVPFGPLNYILAVSRISAKNYLLASPGMLPTLFAVTYYGNVAAHLAKRAAGLEHHSNAHYATMIFGGVVAVITMVYISRVARKALQDADAI